MSEVECFRGELKRLFYVYDDDNSGYLEQDEVRKMVDDLRFSMYLPKSDNDMQKRLMNLLDEDGSGGVDLDELLNSVHLVFPIIQEPGEDLIDFLTDEFYDIDFDDSGF